MKEFTGFRIHSTDNGVRSGFDTLTIDDLTDGDVILRATHSGINYKDALAATGAGRILRRYPLVGGIDVAGVVEHSDSANFNIGDPVLITGCGLSEDHDGGYAEYVRAPAASVIPMPDGMDAWQAMCIGTAGFTAALAVERMERNDQVPGQGPVVVTGASGGVGSFAVSMLAGLGYEVVAVTGKSSSHEYLKALGAARIVPREDIDFGKRPMEKALWGGAVDNVGGEMLAWLTRTVDWWGNIASIGLAGGHELNTTVMPFILRGVNLLGINSVQTPRALREKVWARLAADLAPRDLRAIGTRTESFAKLPELFEPYLRGEVTGRTVIEIP